MILATFIENLYDHRERNVENKDEGKRPEIVHLKSFLPEDGGDGSEDKDDKDNDADHDPDAEAGSILSPDLVRLNIRIPVDLVLDEAVLRPVQKLDIVPEVDIRFKLLFKI